MIKKNISKTVSEAGKLDYKRTVFTKLFLHGWLTQLQILACDTGKKLVGMHNVHHLHTLGVFLPYGHSEGTWQLLTQRLLGRFVILPGPRPFLTWVRSAKCRLMLCQGNFFTLVMYWGLNSQPLHFRSSALTTQLWHLYDVYVQYRPIDRKPTRTKVRDACG